MSDSPTVFVVDDDQAVRKSVEMLVGTVGLPVKAFDSAQHFLDAYDPSMPGCLVLDVRMKGMNGLDLQQHLRSRGVSIPIIIVTGYGDVPLAVRALKQGAVEFIEKPYPRRALLEHIQRALELDAQQRSEESRVAAVQARLQRLTARERQVLELVAAGKFSKEVAAELKISKKTVDVHRARVMQKLEVDSVAELVGLVMTAHQAAHPT